VLPMLHLLHKQKGEEVQSKGGKLESQTCKHQGKQAGCKTNTTKGGT
jgi:hypothetical protein